jgi:hypothetical protein
MPKGVNHDGDFTLTPALSIRENVNALGEVQSASGEELSALRASNLNKVFKGKL